MPDTNDDAPTRVRERAPEDEPDLVRALDAAVRERAFWVDATPRMTRRYPERFVVVLDGGTDTPDGVPVARLVGDGPDLASVEPIRRAWLAKGVPLERLWVRFLSASPRRLILL
jgi:hypothetical protein